MVWGEVVKTIFPEVLATGLPPQTRRVRGGRPVASTEGKIVSLLPRNNHVVFVLLHLIFMRWWGQFIEIETFPFANNTTHRSVHQRSRNDQVSECGKFVSSRIVLFSYFTCFLVSHSECFSHFWAINSSISESHTLTSTHSDALLSVDAAIFPDFGVWFSCFNCGAPPNK